MNTLPDDYRTGNTKMDKLISEQLAKEERPFHKTRLQRILTLIEEAKEPENKYHVSEKEERTYKDGTLFASKAEMIRWDELLLIEKSGEIENLQRQIPFELQAGFRTIQWGLIKPITYVCDFLYTNLTYRKGYAGMVCVEDSKGGMVTDAYKIKKKMFLLKYPQYPFFEV